jgi:hypothetical protein
MEAFLVDNELAASASFGSGYARLGDSPLLKGARGLSSKAQPDNPLALRAIPLW